MKLETLYSRRGDGKVQEWTIEVEDDKFRTLSGLTDGQKVISEWTIAKAKSIGRSNATTPESQAIAEAKAKWQKKRDKGYSPTIEAVDDHGLFKPMLAHNYEDHKTKLFKKNQCILSQCKINGMRAITRADGMWTRNGKSITSCPHIVKVLAPLFLKYPDLVLDGELYNHELRHKLNRIMELVRKSILSKEDLEKAEESIQYYIYDGVNIDSLGADCLYSQRMPAIMANLKTLKSTVLVPVKATVVNTEEELDKEFKQLLADDWEGQMIRIDAPYQNKRTSKLLKRKLFVDSEYVIVDVIEGIGNWTGAAKSIVCQHPDGRTFSSNIEGDYEYLQQVLKDRLSLIGKTATVKYFEKTEYDIPQFPFVTAIDREGAEGESCPRKDKSSVK